MRNQKAPRNTGEEGRESRLTDTVPAPVPSDPPTGCLDLNLYSNVRNAIYALPDYFKTDLSISGVLATDLFTFNSSLGASIEAQVVEALNKIRAVWDPDEKYIMYSFVRQAQRFPDVILRASAPGIEPEILIGIELKGWYVLSKEREPSFRYKVTRNVCAPCDLLVVYPWALDRVISGSPRLLRPYLVGARFAAEYRNWHWQYKRSERGAVGRNGVRLSSITHSYPSKAELILDDPASDRGGNFGRFARTGVMDEYMAMVFQEKLAGIPLSAWQRFLSLFSEDRGDEEVAASLETLVRSIATGRSAMPESVAEALQTAS